MDISKENVKILFCKMKSQTEIKTLSGFRNFLNKENVFSSQQKNQDKLKYHREKYPHVYAYIYTQTYIKIYMYL